MIKEEIIKILEDAIKESNIDDFGDIEKIIYSHAYLKGIIAYLISRLKTENISKD